LPQEKTDKDLQLRAKRLTINAALQAFANEPGSRGLTTFFDLATQLPQFSLSALDRKKYWDDGTCFFPLRNARANQPFVHSLLFVWSGLHFTAAGYDRLGELLYAHMCKHGLVSPNSNETSTGGAISESSGNSDISQTLSVSERKTPAHTQDGALTASHQKRKNRKKKPAQ
jgi:hypothetical protein